MATTSSLDSRAAIFLSRAAKTDRSKARIRRSKACKSQGTWHFSKQSIERGFNKNSPFNVRTRDSTTYIQLGIRDHDATISLSFDIPCNLCPVVASFILIGICVMLTPFNLVRSLTASSSETST